MNTIIITKHLKTLLKIYVEKKELLFNDNIRIKNVYDSEIEEIKKLIKNIKLMNEPLKEFINSNIEGFPKNKTIIDIMNNDILYHCEWIPYNEYEYCLQNKFLGTAVVISGEHKGKEFHSWEKSNSEIFYKLASNI